MLSQRLLTPIARLNAPKGCLAFSPYRQRLPHQRHLMLVELAQTPRSARPVASSANWGRADMLQPMRTPCGPMSAGMAGHLSRLLLGGRYLLTESDFPFSIYRGLLPLSELIRR